MYEYENTYVFVLEFVFQKKHTLVLVCGLKGELVLPSAAPQDCMVDLHHFPPWRMQAILGWAS